MIQWYLCWLTAMETWIADTENSCIILKVRLSTVVQQSHGIHFLCLLFHSKVND